MKRIVLLMAVLCAVAAAQPTCSLYSVVGTYVTSYMGWLTMAVPNAPPTTVSGGIFGVMSIDYDGTISGAAAISGLGPVTDYVTSGTLTIKPDCTGTMKLTSKPKGTSAPAGQVETDRFVFLPDVGEIHTVIWDMGPGMYPALLGAWKRMSRTPRTHRAKMALRRSPIISASSWISFPPTDSMLSSSAPA